MELNIAKATSVTHKLRVQQPELHRPASTPEPTQSDSTQSHFMHLYSRPQQPGGTNLLKNSQDNDKLPPDLAAALSTIHVAEHRVKKFYSLAHILPRIL